MTSRVISTEGKGSKFLMGMQLPDWARTIFMVMTGDGWPEADEDQLWQLARGWAGVSDTVYTLEHQVVDPVRAVRRTDWDGPAAEAFAASSDALMGQSSQQLTGLACGAQELSEFLHETGVNVQYMKIIVIGELLILQAQIGWLVAMSPWTFGGSTAAVPALQMAGRSFALLAVRQLTISIVTGQVMQVGLDATTQLMQMAAGTRKDWNTHLTTSAAITGAVGAAVGLPLGVLGNAAGRALTSIVGKKVSEGLEHIVTNAVQEYSTDVGTGVVTGRGFVHSPFSLTAGAIEGAVDAGGGILRGKRRGMGMPDAPTIAELSKASTVDATLATGPDPGPDAVASQSGPAQSGPAQSGPAQSDPAQSGPAQSGPAQAVPSTDLSAGPIRKGPSTTGGVPAPRLAPPMTVSADDTGTAPAAVPNTPRPQHLLPGGPVATDGQVSGALTPADATASDGIRRDGESAGLAYRLRGGQSVYRMQTGPPPVVTGYVPAERRERLEIMHTAQDGPGEGSSQPGALNENRPMMLTRRVSSNGVVSLGTLPGTSSYPVQYRRLNVGRAWTGRQVTVRFEPGHQATQDRVVAILGGVVVTSLAATDLQLTPASFARLDGATNTTDPIPPARVEPTRPMVITRTVTATGLVALGSLPGNSDNGPSRGGPRRLYVDGGLAGEQVAVRFDPGPEPASDRILAIAGGEVVKSLAATDLQLTRAAFTRMDGVRNTTDPVPPARLEPVRPLVISRKVSTNSVVSLGSLPGQGPGSARKRRLLIGGDRIGQQVTVRFEPGHEPAQDRVVAIADGHVIASTTATELQLTRDEFARLNPTTHTSNPPPAAPAPHPGRPIGPIGATVTGPPPAHPTGTGKRTAQQANLDADTPPTDTTQRRVRPRDTEPSSSAPPASPAHPGQPSTQERTNLDQPPNPDQPMMVTRKISLVGVVMLGSLPGHGFSHGRLRRFSVGSAWAGRHVIIRLEPGHQADQDRIVAIIDGQVIKSLAATELQLTRDAFARLNRVTNTTDPIPVAPAPHPGPIRPIGATVAGPPPAHPIGTGKRTAQQANLDDDTPPTDTTQRRVRPRDTEASSSAPPANPAHPGQPANLDQPPNPNQPMMVTRKVSVVGVVTLGSRPGHLPGGVRPRRFSVGLGWAGRRVIIRFDPGHQAAPDRILAIVDDHVITTLTAAELQLTRDEFAGLGGASNTTDPLPVAPAPPPTDTTQRRVRPRDTGPSSSAPPANPAHPGQPANLDQPPNPNQPMMVTRKVSLVGIVTLGSRPGHSLGRGEPRRFPVGSAWAGRQVNIRFDPGHQAAQDQLVAIVDGEVIKSLSAANLQLTREEFAGLGGASNATNPLPPAVVDPTRPMAVTRKVTFKGVVSLGSLPGHGPGPARQRKLTIGRGRVGQQVNVLFVQGQGVAQDRIVAIVDGVVVTSAAATDLQLTRDAFAGLERVTNTTDPLPVAPATHPSHLVVTREASANGIVALGHLPGNAPSWLRERRFSVGSTWAGRQVTIRFDPGHEAAAQDQIVAIVDGVVVTSLAATDLQLTADEFARLAG